MHKLLFFPNQKGEDDIIYEARLKNLLFRISSRRPSVITLYNSIHKFYDNYNHTDFALSDIANAFAMISEASGLDWFKAVPIEFAVGLCIQVSDIDALLSNLVSYKSQSFATPFFKKNRPLQKTYSTEYYRLKAYNKTEEARQKRITIAANTLRWEKNIKNLRRANHSSFTAISSINELLKLETLTELMHELTKDFDDCVIKRDWTRTQGLSYSDHKCILLVESADTAIKEHVQKHNYKSW
ncbi:MAG TPA: hypothetical protein VD794_09470, partial [Flavisolibacter sp.]|nr:hypothetical protein [Flavisolibacter sp.]